MQDIIIRTRYPLELAKLIESTCLENDPRLHSQLFVELCEHALRHLALVDLGVNEHPGLKDQQVESCHQELMRPSLGHWIALLRALDNIITMHKPVVGPHVNSSRLDIVIYE